MPVDAEHLIYNESAPDLQRKRCVAQIRQILIYSLIPWQVVIKLLQRYKKQKSRRARIMRERAAERAAADAYEQQQREDAESDLADRQAAEGRESEVSDDAMSTNSISDGADSDYDAGRRHAAGSGRRQDSRRRRRSPRDRGGDRDRGRGDREHHDSNERWDSAQDTPSKWDNDRHGRDGGGRQSPGHQQHDRDRRDRRDLSGTRPMRVRGRGAEIVDGTQVRCLIGLLTISCINFCIFTRHVLVRACM